MSDPNFAIFPLPLGTATVAHWLWRSRAGRICSAVPS